MIVKKKVNFRRLKLPIFILAPTKIFKNIFSNAVFIDLFMMRNKTVRIQKLLIFDKKKKKLKVYSRYSSRELAVLDFFIFNFHIKCWK